MDLAERLLTARKDKGWTQAKLASVSGVGIRTISRAENGADPGPRVLRKLSKALEIQVLNLGPSKTDKNGVEEDQPSLDPPEVNSMAVPIIPGGLLAQWNWESASWLHSHAEGAYPMQTSDRRAFLVRAEGEELTFLDDIQEGCIFLVEPSTPRRDGDLVLVKTETGPHVRLWKLTKDGGELRGLPNQETIEWRRSLSSKTFPILFIGKERRPR